MLLQTVSRFCLLNFISSWVQVTRTLEKVGTCILQILTNYKVSNMAYFWTCLYAELFTLTVIGQNTTANIYRNVVPSRLSLRRGGHRLLACRRNRKFSYSLGNVLQIVKDIKSGYFDNLI